METNIFLIISIISSFCCIAMAATIFKNNKAKTPESAPDDLTLMNSLVQTMAEADEFAAAHSERITKLAEQLAQRLNLTDQEKHDLALLCQFHDIGKLGISLDIVNKPGRLTDYEWVVMRTHVNKGYNIASASKELSGIADYILCHHEWWDGSGYPDGLKHESIPMLSRVLSIIDAYDAMTTNKPYREAISSEAAREEIRRCAGTQFDPYLASEFLQMMEELNPAAEENSEEVKENVSRAFEFVKVDSVDSTVNNNPNVAKAIACEYTIANDTSIIIVDDNFENLTGYSFEDVKALHLTQLDLLPEEDARDYKTAVDMQLVIDSTAFVQHRLRRKDGSLQEVVSYGAEFYSEIDREIQARIKVISMEKTLAIKKAKKEARDSAERYINRWEGVIRRDSLTKLFNHEAFVTEVETMVMEKSDANGGIFMMLDIDNFKNYNDSYGHMTGDLLLQTIAAALKDNTADHGIAGRLGGDEFAAFITLEKGKNSYEDVRKTVSAMFDALSKSLSGCEHPATLSMGAVYCGKELNNFRAMYGAADKALYYSKDTGRNRFTLMFPGE